MSETQTTLKDAEEGLSDSPKRRDMLAWKDGLLRGWEAGAWLTRKMLPCSHGDLSLNTQSHVKSWTQ